MQLDMHYYGTYAMARAAGLKQEAARITATSAQFVDDNHAANHVEFGDGVRVDKEATAHHVQNLKNLYDQDQRQVWVPFHFMPGNEGDTYTEQLKCRKDSPIVREMLDHHLTLSDRAFALQLLGIAAHVYADTFSHYGFSGVSSRGNKVNSGSFRYHEKVEGANEPIEKLSPDMRTYVIKKVNGFFKKNGKFGGLLSNIRSALVEGKGALAEKLSGALGHGAVATLPDRPYLVWSFKYERRDTVAGIHSVRNNPETYLEGCRALHNMFKQFIERRTDYDSGDGRDFDTIEPEVRKVLRTQADKDGRIEAWQEAARSGNIFGNGTRETIPEYDGNAWNEEWEQLNDDSKSHQIMIDLPVWRFYQAASLHRVYVLRDLLPKHELIVN